MLPRSGKSLGEDTNVTLAWLPVCSRGGGLAAPTAVFAALISVGTGLGPGTGVLDTTTGNVWIKFSAQQPNKTAGDLPLILAQPGYAGFQLATSAQITMLVSNELAALGGPKVNTFDALITAFGPSFVRDDSGTGSMLSFGAVDTAIGPIVTVTPIDSNSNPTGPSFQTGSHRVYSIGIDKPTDQLFFPITSSGFDSTLPDVYTTQYIIPPPFAANVTPFLEAQGFNFDVMTLPLDNLAFSSSGFWLVSPAAAIPEPQALLLLGIALGVIAAIRPRQRRPAATRSA